MMGADYRQAQEQQEHEEFLEEQKMSIFKTLSELNVNEHVEQKGKFSYLSWAWAVSELRKASPTATWEVIKYNGVPFCKTECGYFVEVSVTVDGITLSQIHPVLDNSNKPITAPNAFQINTSIQRCLVKAIALHGLGLYIYAGEDLPEIDELQILEKALTAISNAKSIDEIGSHLKAAVTELPAYKTQLQTKATERKEQLTLKEVA